MIEALLSGTYDAFDLVHVRLEFSKELGEAGSFHPRKVAHLAGTCLRIVFARLRYRATVLYYPPAGPRRVPMYRDLVVLISTRWIFRKCIFHFHAGGLADLYDDLGPLGRWLFRVAYFDVDLAIRTAALAPDDPGRIRARRSLVVPNGIPDRFGPRSAAVASTPPRILFVGLISEQKGVSVLLEACRSLRSSGVEFRLDLMGPLHGPEYRQELDTQIAEAGMADTVNFLGVLTGEAKSNVFAKSTILCNPTFFESETFSLVVLEGMQFSLPVVATRWRGIPGLVEHGVTGLLVEPRDATSLSEALANLLCEPETARLLGENGRRRYLAEFTLEAFRHSMDDAISAVCDEGTRQ